VKAVLPGGGPVTDVDFTRDGKLLVAADGDGKARIYRADDGRLIRTLPHGSLLSAAVFSPDGSEVVTAGEDGTARILAGANRRAAISAASRRAGDERGLLPRRGLIGHDQRGWDRQPLECADRPASASSRPPSRVRSASFSGDGSLLVTVLVPAARDHSARVWDVASGTPLEQFDTGDTVTSCSVRADRPVPS